MSNSTEMLDLYLKAERAVLGGQSYTINGRTLTRADLPGIRAGRQEWERKVSGEQVRRRGGSTLYSVADFSE